MADLGYWSLSRSGGIGCVAAGPARSRGERRRGLAIGIQAVRVALAGFVVPYMAVYAPALMLQDGGPLA